MSELDSHAHAATTLLILTTLTLTFVINMDIDNACRTRILLQEHGVWASTFYGEWMFSFYVLLIYPHVIIIILSLIIFPKIGDQTYSTNFDCSLFLIYLTIMYMARITFYLLFSILFKRGILHNILYFC